jgi:hypothetical protein
MRLHSCRLLGVPITVSNHDWRIMADEMLARIDTACGEAQRLLRLCEFDTARDKLAPLACWNIGLFTLDEAEAILTSLLQ